MNYCDVPGCESPAVAVLSESLQHHGIEKTCIPHTLTDGHTPDPPSDDTPDEDVAGSIGPQVTRHDNGMVTARCRFCDAFSTSGFEMAVEMIQNHMNRMHPEKCTVCGDQGSIPAVPEPMECPACGGERRAHPR